MKTPTNAGGSRSTDFMLMVAIALANGCMTSTAAERNRALHEAIAAARARRQRCLADSSV